MSGVCPHDFKRDIPPPPHIQKTIPASKLFLFQFGLVAVVAVDDDDVHKIVVMLPLSMHLLILPSLSCLVK